MMISWDRSTFYCALQDDIVVGNELRQAAFKAYASLGANDEDIRKKVGCAAAQQLKCVLYL